MSVTRTRVGRPSVRGDKTYHTFDLVFGGTYPTGGEPITALDIGLQTPIEEVILPPVAGTTPITPVYNADGSVNIKFFETTAGAAGTPPLQEKTNGEAYVANTNARVTFIGAS